MNRYIAVVGKTADGSVESFDFRATSMQGAGSRARITALARFGDPEEFVIAGIVEVPVEASDEDVEGHVEVLVSRFNAS